jgi:hypothetical protein
MTSLLLAQNASTLAIHPPTRFPAQHDLLTFCQNMGIGTALLLILLGAVYLLYGWSAYKVLITLNVALVCGYIGAIVGQQLGGFVLAGAFVAAVASAALAFPLIKWAVAVMGGLCGSLVGASLWLSADLPPDLAWAGAMTGLVGFGLFAFILFRGSIIMYTSIQGAMMVIIGGLGLVYKYQEFSPAVTQGISTQPFMLPLLVFVPAMVGLIYQQFCSPGGAPAGAGSADKKK